MSDMREKQPEKRKVFSLDKNQTFDIPTNRSRDEELTLFLFKDQAGEYGDFLKEHNINEMPVWLIDKFF